MSEVGLCREIQLYLCYELDLIKRYWGVEFFSKTSRIYFLIVLEGFVITFFSSKSGNKQNIRYYMRL